MKSSSVLLVGVLTQYASAFPGMGNTRREAGLLPLKPLVKAVSTSTSASSNFPAWHPPQTGEGTNPSIPLRSEYRSDQSTVRSPCPGLNSLGKSPIHSNCNVTS
jgi:hypothetical protein